MNSLLLFDIEGVIFSIRAIRFLFIGYLPPRDTFVQICHVFLILLPSSFPSVFVPSVASDNAFELTITLPNERSPARFKTRYEHARTDTPNDDKEAKKAMPFMDDQMGLKLRELSRQHC